MRGFRRDPAARDNALGVHSFLTETIPVRIRPIVCVSCHFWAGSRNGTCSGDLSANRPHLSLCLLAMVDWSDLMEKISRRSVIGVAAGACAGGVLAGEAVAVPGKSAAEKQKSEPAEAASGKTE